MKVNIHRKAEPNAYGPDTFRPTVLLAVICLHVVVAALILTARFVQEVEATPQRLAAFDFAPPPEAEKPEVAEPQTAEVPTPDVVAPVPELDLSPPQPIRVALEPPPPMPAKAVPATVSTPASAFSPANGVAPSSVVPPDFGAAQLGNPAPAYPYQSRRAREEGLVMLRVLVSEKGQAKTVQVAESSGFELLDEAALKTVRTWRFLPARRGGDAVTAWVLVPVTFSLG